MIKEFCAYAKIAVIRERRYGSSLQKFLDLYNAALVDFPHLSPNDITVVHYGGDCYAKTFGIEFSTDFAPSSYSPIESLELTR